MADIISKKEKIKIINAKLEGIEINISWLNSNIGILEEIPTPDKMTMTDQLSSLIIKKDILIGLLDQLQ
jgi:hypothetical protein